MVHVKLPYPTFPAAVASGSTQQTAHIMPMTEQSLLDAAGTTGWAAHRLARSPHMYVSVGLVDVLSVCDIVIIPPLTHPMRRHLSNQSSSSFVQVKYSTLCVILPRQTQNRSVSGPKISGKPRSACKV